MANVRTDNVQIKLQIDGSQSRTELDNLTRKSQVLREELKGLKKGSQEYIDKNKEISQVTARVDELQKEIGITGLTTTQLENKARQLNRELKNLTPNTQAFKDKAEELGQVTARLDQVRKDAKGISDELDKSGNGFLNFAKKSAAFVGIQIGIESVVSSLRQLGSESIDAAAKGSDSIADMEKSLNVTTEGAKALRSQLEGIDTRTSQEELEGIAVAGGQLGVAAADVDEFTVAVDQAVVALGDEFTGGVDDVTKSIGGLQKLFKETKDQKPDEAITKIGSALNALGADGSATSPVIAEFTARIGQLGDLAPQITQTLGLGAAFQELGLSAEISSGGVTNVLLTASKETGKFAAQLGMTDEQFKKLLNSDPNEVLLRLAESLKGASNTQIVSTLDALGIKSQEATKVVSLLANQTDIVRQKQALASAEFQKGTSLTEEFTKKNTNSAAEIAKSEKNFARYRRELGDQLIPIYIKGLQYLTLFIEGLKAAPEFISENRALFAALGFAIITLNLANIKAAASTLAVTAAEKARAVATRASTAALWLLDAAAAANPLGLMVVGAALLVGALVNLYNKSEAFRESVAGLANVCRVIFNNIKEIALETLGGLADLIAGVFTGNINQIRLGLVQLRGVGAKVSQAYHEGYQAQEAKEHQAAQTKTAERNEQKKKADVDAANKRASAVAAVDHAANIERLKQQQASLELQLSKAKEGSEQELKLKKQLVLVARDIELEDEKKTAGDRAIIRSKAQVELNKLNQDYAKKRLEEAKKAADALKKQEEEEAEAAAANLKRRADLEKDEYKRKAAELRAAAAQEATKLKGSDAQIAEARKLIAAKLEQDLLALERDRVQKQAAIMREIEQVDADLAVRRAERARQRDQQSNPLRDGATDAAAKAARIAQLQLDLEAELSNEELSNNQRLARIRQFHEAKAGIEEEFRESGKQRDYEGAAFALDVAQQSAQLLFDFKKIGRDKEQQQLDKDKGRNLTRLDQEYKSGRISKEQYENQKSAIESNYDQKTRALKRKAAEDEKAANIASTIMAGTLAVLKASQNPLGFLSPTAIATAAFSALSLIKVIATPLPTYETGGVVGAAWRGVKRGARNVREYARGGRINPMGGIADVGQRHSNGGIQMIDGATGEHLGEWERGEAYMILSRETVANNGDLVNELLDTSMYRGGARVRPRGQVYAEDGAVVGQMPTGRAAGGDQAAVVAAVDRQTAVMVELASRPMPAVIDWGVEDDAYLEARLDDRARVRRQSEG